MSRIFVLIVLIYTTTFSYGANCCCTSQTTKSSAAVVDYENITGYDLVSNVLSTQETYLGSAVASRTVTNGYDDVYRLLSEKAVAGSTTTTTSYTYDTANNRSTQEVQVVTGSNTTTTNTTYNYNNLDQVTSTTGALVASFGYDVDGNRTTQTIGTATNTYTYDAENRLVELVQGTGTGNGTYNYAYDYRSRRILRDESAAAGVLTQLVYSGGTSVQEYKTSDSSQSNLQVEFIRGSDYGGGVGGILYSLRGSTPSYTHANKRGDITAKTTSSGAITYLSQYQAFGDQVATSGTTQDRQKSNSKEQDPWGGHNEGMRYRDDFGFLTRDPAGMIDGPNEYCYVRQNPWTSFDPEGLTLQEAGEALLGGAAGYIQSNTFGYVNFRGTSGAFNLGKGYGNVIAGVQGSFEIADGLTAVFGGGGLSVTPAGLTGVPEVVAAGGVLLAGHGTALASFSSVQAAQNFQTSANEFAAESGGGTSSGNSSGVPGTKSARRTGVKPYEVGTKKELDDKALPKDGLQHDHQPSYASLVERFKLENGREPTVEEAKEIYDKGISVAVPTKLHESSSPTYGGRNTKALQTQDAADPVAAATRDSNAMVNAASAENKAAAATAAKQVQDAAPKSVVPPPPPAQQ
jgi:RHS repeat-associated protein